MYQPKTPLRPTCYILSFVDGIVFTWGANNYGQLGTGSPEQYCNVPQPLLSIRGIPVLQIVTGGNHSFILSMSGALFGWGRNRSVRLKVKYVSSNE